MGARAIGQTPALSVTADPDGRTQFAKPVEVAAATMPQSTMSLGARPLRACVSIA
jgi:hypothetical protein